MKRLLLIVLFVACRAYAAPSMIQHTFHLNQTTISTAQAFGSNVTLHSTVCAGVISSSLATTGVTGVSDTLNGAYTSQIVFLNGNTHINAEIWCFPNSLAGADTVTVTLQASALNNVHVFEMGNLPTTNPLDTTANGFLVTGTALASGAFTTTQSSEILVALAGEYSTGGVTYASQAGWTLADTTQFSGLMFEVVSSIQTGATATMTASVASSGAIVVATFKAASAGGVQRRR